MKLSTCAPHNLQKARRERAHRNKGQAHTVQTSLEGNLYPPHIICIHLTGTWKCSLRSSQLSSRGKIFCTWQITFLHRAEFVVLKNLIRQPQIAPSRLHLQWTFWNLQVTAFYGFFKFCSVILKILMFLFNTAWSESLISTETRPSSSPKSLFKHL